MGLPARTAPRIPTRRNVPPPAARAAHPGQLQGEPRALPPLPTAARVVYCWIAILFLLILAHLMSLR